MKDWAGTALLILLLACAPAQASERFSGLGIVRDDGLLFVGRNLVKLFGIDIPIFERTCRTFTNPPRCAARAVLVLDSLVDGFVVCDPVRVVSRDVVEAVCTVDSGRFGSGSFDLAAEMLIQGYALTDARAPRRYLQLERIAERRGAGIWSDRITNFR